MIEKFINKNLFLLKMGAIRDIPEQLMPVIERIEDLVWAIEGNNNGKERLNLNKVKKKLPNLNSSGADDLVDYIDAITKEYDGVIKFADEKQKQVFEELKSTYTTLKEKVENYCKNAQKQKS